MSEEYNGYKNFDTWRLCLNLDNDQGWYEQSKTFKSISGLKEWVEVLAYNSDFNVYKLMDTWSEREWAEIDWIEVFETRKEENGSDTSKPSEDTI